MLAAPVKQYGNSLVELMISMTLGLASITAMASLVGHGIALNSSLLAKSRLDEEMNAVVAVVSHDLKRAGYYALTNEMVENPTHSSNPFDGSLSVAAYTAEPINSCINFAYDRNKNGLLDTSPNNEMYGFRLRDHAVEIRLNGAACDESGWHDLTDPKVVQVTALKFMLEQSSVQNVIQTRVTIELQARLKKHPEILRSINTNVLIENYE
ncbi:prepilin peptidase dependent protein B [Paraglaciecola sp. MB-3u-78]|uniref:prepilin peptidase dependent protein B n=1 Tax=Paraglaciecola sp. MB-3u-78 TaxID=2058332 RepID=UPI000C33442D|nr:prepilin peptidase dependent protein B [Paraglaciecola sp. MB-3u-78]PKH00923.1 prepilin peptidase dependent protein B [Paraglaciecola sp. MB-3u-78]